MARNAEERDAFMDDLRDRVDESTVATKLVTAELRHIRELLEQRIESVERDVRKRAVGGGGIAGAIGGVLGGFLAGFLQGRNGG